MWRQSVDIVNFVFYGDNLWIESVFCGDNLWIEFVFCGDNLWT